ncbi:hypothetical protein [Pararhodobacter sp.]|uniref:hypothetical protein n=1 Tax=Pararhodobacter sp. TaxID=2127056 RepID=UPI002FDE834E
MRPFLFLIALALMPQPGQAQVNDDGLIIATCRSGEGCHCYLSNQTRGALATVVATDPPEGVAHPVFVVADGVMSWSTGSAHDLDMIYGGEGICDPEIFDPSEARLPRNGLWHLTITGHELDGCPPQVAAAMGGGVVIGQTVSRNIRWPRPFSPAPLTADNPLAQDWVNRGGGRWSSRVIDERGEGGGFGRVTFHVSILSDREIAQTSVFSTNALAVLGAGGTCTSTTHATLRFGG